MTPARSVLVLALQTQNLRSPVIAWALYGPTDGEGSAPGSDDQPPYATPVDAMRDGWRLVQYSRNPDPPPGAELRPGTLGAECVLEREHAHA